MSFDVVAYLVWVMAIGSFFGVGALSGYSVFKTEPRNIISYATVLASQPAFTADRKTSETIGSKTWRHSVE